MRNQLEFERLATAVNHVVEAALHQLHHEKHVEAGVEKRRRSISASVVCCRGGAEYVA